MTRKMLFLYSYLSQVLLSYVSLCLSQKPENNSVLNSREGDKGQIGETSENLTTSGPLINSREDDKGKTN